MADQALREQLRDYIKRDILRDASYPLGDSDPLISSGLIDSFSLVDIAMWVEGSLGVHIDNSELDASTFDTLVELADFIERRQKV